MTLAATVAACGDSSSSDSNEASGKFEVEVVEADFPTEQQLGQTSQLRIGVRNEGDRTVPAVAVTFSIAGKEGETSSLPFGIHDPQPELAQPDRPVWVLAEGSPQIVGSDNPTVAGGVKNPGGGSTSSPKTFDLGALKPHKTVEAIWKLSAVKGGRFTVLYEVEAGLSGSAKAETASGVRPGGSFVVNISDKSPETTVNDAGEVVEVGKAMKGDK